MPVMRETIKKFTESVTNLMSFLLKLLSTLYHYKKKSIHKRKVKLIGWLETKEKGKEFYRTNLNNV